MELHTNETPRVDLTDKPTGCCPRFHPEAWDDQQLHFEDKKFVRASTKSVMHVPVNMSSVFSRTWKAIEDAHAGATGLLVLSHDTSPWKAEHLFAVEDDVPGAEMVKLSGTFLSRVFDGPYSRMGEWQKEMAKTVAAKGYALDTMYFFYPTCPRCAKAYGHNYVVAMAKVR